MADQHTLHRDWRLPRIEALRTDALVIRETLDHLDDLSRMFTYLHEDELATEIRSLGGTLKTRASDYESEAENLTAEVKTEDALVGGTLS